MDVVKAAAEALTEISATGVTVQEGWYDGSLKATHVTIWPLTDHPDAGSDDGLEIETARVQITIFSKNIEMALLHKIRNLMTAAGFEWLEGGQNEIENDSGIYLQPQRFEITWEV